MKALLDFAPIICFVIAYFSTRDFFFATQVIMAAIVLQVALTWLITKEVGKMLWGTAAVILILGALTVAFRDQTFMFWKPTVINGAFALALVIGQLANKIPIQKLEEQLQLKLPPSAWRNLIYGWAIGFATVAALNLYVAYNFSESTWVSYKLWSGFAFVAFFMVCTVAYLYAGKHLELAEEQEEPAAPANANVPPSD